MATVQNNQNMTLITKSNLFLFLMWLATHLWLFFFAFWLYNFTENVNCYLVQRFYSVRNSIYASAEKNTVLTIYSHFSPISKSEENIQLSQHLSGGNINLLSLIRGLFCCFSDTHRKKKAWERQVFRYSTMGYWCTNWSSYKGLISSNVSVWLLSVAPTK